MLRSLLKAVRITNPRKLRLGNKYCPICEKVRTIIRLDDNGIAIRCIACKASIAHLSIADVVTQEFTNLQDASVFELSARGPFFKYLKRKSKNLTSSEFLPGIKTGELYYGILCQDVQNLTFDSCSFDLCTSTDVFEHVADDFLGFKNIYRVLKPKGKVIFTVPLSGETTIQRARIQSNGDLIHLLPPEYHGDPITESGQILAFRNYGYDILDLLNNIGFESSRIVTPKISDYWGIKREVVVAQK